MADTFLVAGASQGLGAAIVQHLLDADWHGVGLARTPMEPRPGLLPLACDCHQREALENLSPRVATEIGGQLRLLVVTVGDFYRAPLAETDDDALAWQLASNVAVPHRLLRWSLPWLRAAAPSHVLFCGLDGTDALRPRREVAAHAASKAALTVLGRSWAEELASDEIRVEVPALGRLAHPGAEASSREGGQSVEECASALLSAFSTT